MVTLFLELALLLRQFLVVADGGEVGSHADGQHSPDEQDDDAERHEQHVLHHMARKEAVHLLVERVDTRGALVHFVNLEAEEAGGNLVDHGRAEFRFAREGLMLEDTLGEEHRLVASCGIDEGGDERSALH